MFVFGNKINLIGKVIHHVKGSDDNKSLIVSVDGNLMFIDIQSMLSMTVNTTSEQIFQVEHVPGMEETHIALGFNNIFSVYDIKKNNTVAQVELPIKMIIFKFAFFNSGKMIAMTTTEGHLYTYCIGAQKAVMHLCAKKGYIQSFDVLDDDKLIVCYADGKFSIYDALSGCRLSHYNKDYIVITKVYVSKQHKGVFYTAGMRTPVTIWSYFNNVCTKLYQINDVMMVTNFSMSPDEMTMICMHQDSSLTYVDIETKSSQLLYRHNKQIWCIEFSHDGKTIFVGTEGSGILTFNKIT